MPPKKLAGHDLLNRLRDGSIMPMQDKELFTKKVMESFQKMNLITVVFDQVNRPVGFRITDDGRRVLEFVEKNKASTPGNFFGGS